MIRRYHRWLSILFGIFLIWIAATGLLSHGAALYADAVEQPLAAAAAPATLIPTAQAHEKHPAAPPQATAAPAGFTCPETMTCRVKPDPDGPRAWVSFFHHLHAGEEFGPVGTTLSILSGLALLFFAISGLWMYIDLYRGRRGRPARSGDTSRFFWK